MTGLYRERATRPGSDNLRTRLIAKKTGASFNAPATQSGLIVTP